MVNYDYYLRELTTAFKAYSEQSSAELDKLTTQYNNEERAIKERFNNRMNVLRADLSSSIEKLDREIASIQRERGSNNKSLGDELLRLREEENALTPQYNEMKSLASEKSRKRAEIQAHPFRMWWYSPDKD